MGLFFEYFPGYLRVAFAHDRFDWLQMRLDIHGDARAVTPCDRQFNKGTPNIETTPDATVTLGISAVECPFHDLVSWLEAVACGVQECATTWNAEGPDARLHWHRSIWGQGYLTVAWTEGDPEHRVLLERRQMVEAFYRAFRGFVESPAYQPMRYEDLTEAQALELTLTDPDVLSATAAAIAALNRDRAMALWGCLMEAVADCRDQRAGRRSLAEIVATANSPDAHPERFPWWPAAWETMTVAARQVEIQQSMSSWTMPGNNSGGPLRSMRSAMVENWLAETGEEQGTSPRKRD